MSRTEPPEKCPVAVICWVSPRARVTGSGSTSIELRVSFVTVRKVTPDPRGRVAESVVVPEFTPVTRPSDPAEFEIVAALVFEDDHRTWVVRLLLEPSL